LAEPPRTGFAEVVPEVDVVVFPEQAASRLPPTVADATVAPMPFRKVRRFGL
jgi:hypothetical protein